MASSTYRGLTDPALATMTPKQRYWYFREKLLERDGGLCGICGLPVTLKDLDLDHIDARRMGGHNHWDNLRATHAVCNRRRGGQMFGFQSGVSFALAKCAEIVSLPTDVHAALVEWAKLEERSLNGHILYLLRRALREWR